MRASLRDVLDSIDGMTAKNGVYTSLEIAAGRGLCDLADEFGQDAAMLFYCVRSGRRLSEAAAMVGGMEPSEARLLLANFENAVDETMLVI